MSDAPTKRGEGPSYHVHSYHQQQVNIEIKLYQSSHLLGAIFTTIHPVESIGSHGGAGGVSVSVSTRLVGGKNDNL